MSRGPALDLLSWAPEDEERVFALVESSLRAAGGAWRATITHSAALVQLWFVELARGEEGEATRTVIFDGRADRPDAELLRAVAEMAAGPVPRCRETPPRPDEG